MSSGRSSSIAQTLRERRIARGYSREALASTAGISPRTVYAIESEGVRPQRATVRVLAEALGCRPSDLVTDDRDPSANSGRRRQGDRDARIGAYPEI